jgi:ABC-2 type transport system ATP-binding protein
VVAVDKVDLEIPAGTVFGLLGPNGAGKTTLIKLLSTLIIPTSGSATVNGYDVRTQEREVRASIGLGLGGERSFYWRLTGKQNLEFFATMQGLTGKRLKKRVREVLIKLDLTEVQDVPFMEYSSGMKRKLDIARALLTDPPIFFFDELTSSIDPGAAVRIRELVQELKERGKTVLLVTHNLAEAERLCDVIGIMNHGKMIAMGDSVSLRGLVEGCKVRIQADGKWLELLHILTRLEGMENVRREGSEIVILAGRRDSIVHQIIKAIAVTDVPVQSINVDRPSLEDVFLHLTGSDNASIARFR